MAKQLDMRQHNNLLVGNALAAEIQADARVRGFRAFVVCGAYFEPRLLDRPPDLFEGLTQRRRFSHILNAERDTPDLRYSCSVLTTNEAALTSYLELVSMSYDIELDVREVSRRRSMTIIEELEAELVCHVDDLARLDISWRVVPWGGPLAVLSLVPAKVGRAA